MNRIDSRRLVRALLPYLALWAVLAGTLAVFTVYELAKSREQGLESARAELEGAARLVGEHARQTLQGADRSLCALRAIHEQRLAESPLSLLLPAFHLADNADDRIAAFDRQGRLIAAGGARALPVGTTIANRAYFIDARDEPGDGLRIAAPIGGSPLERSTIPLVRRLRGPGGEFEGVLLSFIDVERLIDIDRGVNLGGTATFGVVRRDGMLYVRNTLASDSADAVEGLLSRSLPLDAKAASYFQRRTVQGAPTLLALQAVAGTPLLAFALLPEAQALAEHHGFARSLAGFAALALAALTLPLALVGRRAVRELHHRSDLERRYEKERRRARSDPLTGAANRAAFDDQLERCNKALATDGMPFVLAFIDIDRFKELNDSHGHVAGDDALRRVAQTLMSAVRSTDLVARFGGDEFAVLMAGATAESSPRVCGKLHAALLGMAAGADLGIGFSIGVVAFEQAPAEPRVVTALADRLMYDVKSAGGEGVRYGVYRQDGLHLGEEVHA